MGTLRWRLQCLTLFPSTWIPRLEDLLKLWDLVVKLDTHKGGVVKPVFVKGINPAPHIHEHLRYTIMAMALRTPSRITTSCLSTLR